MYTCIYEKCSEFPCWCSLPDPIPDDRQSPSHAKLLPHPSVPSVFRIAELATPFFTEPFGGIGNQQSREKLQFYRQPERGRDRERCTCIYIKCQYRPHARRIQERYWKHALYVNSLHNVTIHRYYIEICWSSCLGQVLNIKFLQYIFWIKDTLPIWFLSCCRWLTKD